MLYNIILRFSIKLQGIRNDKKRKQTRGDTDGTIMLFIYPLIFDTKIPRDQEQYYRPVCVSSCFFSFFVVPNPLQFLLKIYLI